MPFSCFRPSSRGEDDHSAPTPLRPRLTDISNRRSTKTPRRVKRQSSEVSRSSTYSNDSISRLPPCRAADPTIEAMMMPCPPEAAKPSKCLRLSLPRTYADIVSCMKCEKGCRDWRNFAVFYEDDVDGTKTAEQYAQEKRASFEKRCAQLNSFSSDDNGKTSVDMVAL